jgi:hypothetical protein
LTGKLREHDLPDYSKLAAEYKEQRDSEARRLAAEQNRAQRLVELFKTLEVQVESEMRKAEDAFGSYGFSGFSGPAVSPADRTIGVRFGAIECELEMDPENNVIRLQLRGENRASREYAMDYERGKITIYRKTESGIADRAAPCSSSEIAEKMVTGLIHGKFD